MKKILVGTTWKMNKTVSESINYAKRLVKFTENNLKSLENIEVFILPTFLAIYPFS